jgi:hypothetical protein
MRLFLQAVIAAFFLSSWRSDAFQSQYRPKKTNYLVASSSTQLFNQWLSLEKTTTREVEQFEGWAAECGVTAENGFYLTRTVIDGTEDYYAVTSTGASAGSRVLYVPGEMILSASRVAQEYEGYLDQSFQILEGKDLIHLYQQFYLFIKIVVEYEQGTNSPYWPWMNSLPRKWNTAVSFDYFCMSTLPPYIKKVCQGERDQLRAFKAALKVVEYISPDTKANNDLLTFAYNVVFTRSFVSDDGDLRIAPVADYFNHGDSANVALCYNENGDCEVILLGDVAPGQPLTLSYGNPTNPSRLLAIYGFLNDPPSTYCKIMYTNPSQRLIDIGYVPEKMLFFTKDGSISQEVWDVMLYSKLERAPGMGDARKALYEAHMSGDEETKFAIHSQFQDATCSELLKHVDGMLKELDQLTTMMLQFNDQEKHPRLPLLLRHHAMVTSTFTKVRAYLLSTCG